MYTDRVNCLIGSGGACGHLLVTILFGDRLIREYIYSGKHPGIAPGAIRAASGSFVIDATKGGSGGLFYKPTLIEWGKITESIDPVKRTIDPKRVSVSLSSDSGFPKSAISPAGSATAIMRIDYWVEGSTLEEAQRVFEGTINSVSFVSETSGVEIEASDDDLFGDEEFPPGNMKIEADVFPAAPKRVLGAYSRTAILGPFEYPVTCPQVDSDGVVFYLCDHPVLQPPNQVMRGDGTIIPPGSWRVSIGEGARLGLSVYDRNLMTMIVLDSPVGGELPYIMCQGGVGLSTSKKPALVLAEDFAGFRISQRVRDILGGADFDQGVLIRSKGKVLSLLSDRLALQTGHFLGPRDGELQLYSVAGEKSSSHIIVGGNSWGRTRERVSETDGGAVFNSIEISFHRNLFSQNYFDAGRNLYILNSSNATGALGRALRESVSRYGPRHIKMEFPDTFVVNPEYQGYPRSVMSFASDFLWLAHRQWRVVQYAVPISYGLGLGVNQLVRLTDEDMGYSAVPSRIISKTLEPWGFRVDIMVNNT